MVRIILAIIAGFVVWTLLWIGTDEVLRMLSPDWYRAHQLGMEKAMTNKAEFTADTGILLISLFRSVIISLASGFLAAVIARGDSKAYVVLGILLLLVGSAVQIMTWNYMPLWYHLLFLALIVPMTYFGGRLREKIS